MVKVKAKRTVRLEGMGELSAQLGVSRSFICRVVNGKARSARIEAALAGLGVKCAPRRRG